MKVTYPTRDEWLAARSIGIGASESAVAIGESRWKSPYALWAEKTGLAEREPLVSEAAEWGLHLEQPIALKFAERSGRRVELVPTNTLYQNDTHKWIIASPDAIQYPRPDERHLPDDSPGALQVKTAGVYYTDEDNVRWATVDYWQENGPPIEYQIQLMHELLATEWDWGSLICLVGGQKLLGPFDYIRDDNFIDGLFSGLAIFWDKVISRTPPDIDSTQATAKALARMYGDGNGEAIDLTPEQELLALELKETRRQKKAIGEKETLLKNQLAAVMGEAVIATMPSGGYLSYRTISKAPYMVYPKPYREMRFHK